MYKNWANDPDVTRYMTWFPHENVSVTEAVISNWVESYSAPDFYQWAIVLKESKEPIGSIGVVELDEDNCCGELGYCIGKQYWHQSYTSEALKEVIVFLFSQAHFQTLIARHDILNPRSGGVMKKCGMRYIETRENMGKTKEDETLSCLYYAIDRDTYL